MDKHTTGLYGKFNVTRTDGKSAPGQRHHGCDYFVLDVTHDPHAKPALAAYANSCEVEYPQHFYINDVPVSPEEFERRWKAAQSSMMRDIPRDVRLRVFAVALAIAATFTALGSVKPKRRPEILRFPDVVADVAYENAVLPQEGIAAMGRATQSPWNSFSKGDAVPIAVDGNGRVICVPPEHQP